MALLHHADLTPTKLELIAAWAPTEPFWPADADPAALRRLGAYRFDDPEGEVGIESILLGVGEITLQVPLTYRGTPLEGGEAFLIGTTEHSVLGTRWVYNGLGDPVYLAELVRVALTGGVEAQQYFEVDGERQVREGDAHVCGSGHPDATAQAERLAGTVLRVPADALRPEADGTTSAVTTGGVDICVVRMVGGASVPTVAIEPHDAVLTGDWDGARGALLAVVRTR